MNLARRVNEKLWYYLILAGIKTRLFVFEYGFEPGTAENDGMMVMTISGRWRWQKP